MSDRDNFSDSIKREIASWSSWHCMICYEAVSKKGMPEIAHIVPASKKGPRAKYREQYNEEFRKSNGNGLLLCAKHHNEIDAEEYGTKYTIEYLFNRNKTYREKHEFENLVNNELFSNEKNDDTERAIKKLLEYLNMSEDELSEQVRTKYAEEIGNKVELNKKLKTNNFDTRTSRNIKMFVNYNALYFYSALTNTNEEVGNLYLFTAIRALYLKMGNTKTEQEKYNKMLKVLKQCCSGLEFEEEGLLNYYLYICEVFLK